MSRKAENRTMSSRSTSEPGSPNRRRHLIAAKSDTDVMAEIFLPSVQLSHASKVDTGRGVDTNCTHSADLAVGTKETESEAAAVAVAEAEQKEGQSHSLHLQSTLDDSDGVFADELELAAWTPLPPSPSPKKKKKAAKRTPQTSSPPSDDNMPPLQPIPLLICSIGNPGSAYANTLHSAGHTLLASLRSHLQESPQPHWTLYASPSYMNESGKPIAKAHTTWQRGLGGQQGKLVILHDELEKPLGAVSVREGQGLSAKGHNGIKSLLQYMGKTGFVRVGVGIGRPVSREPNDVASYVLKKMNAREREKVEGAAGVVYEKLRGLSGG